MLAIIQARMTSQRLPGKVLRLMAGKPMLQWVYDRLSLSANLSKVMIATSNANSDAPICEYCSRHNIPYYRGPLEDVALRFLECASREAVDAFVRISGDSPLIDPSLVDQAIDLQVLTSCDLATNVKIRSYPKGQSVEVIRTKALQKAYQKMRDAQNLEHVTGYFYTHPELFKIKNFSNADSMSNIQLSVDTLEDFQSAEFILKLADKGFDWQTAAAMKLELMK
jgi:spore coat polysaccharide biosynthesis protein SpsF